MGNLGKNTVGPKQLKKNSVTTAKIKKEAVTAGKVKKGTLTGTQVKASTLGTVPNARPCRERRRRQLPAGTRILARGRGAGGEPSFQHGRLNAGFPDTASVRFYKDQIGIVHLEGIYNGCSADGVTAFQLPPGFRPLPNLNFSVPEFGEEGVIVVYGSAPDMPATEFGSVKCPVALCILDGITFRAES